MLQRRNQRFIQSPEGRFVFPARSVSGIGSCTGKIGRGPAAVDNADKPVQPRRGRAALIAERHRLSQGVEVVRHDGKRFLPALKKRRFGRAAERFAFDPRLRTADKNRRDRSALRNGIGLVNKQILVEKRPQDDQAMRFVARNGVQPPLSVGGFRNGFPLGKPRRIRWRIDAPLPDNRCV